MGTDDLLWSFSDVDLCTFEVMGGQLELMCTPIKLLRNWYSRWLHLVSLNIPNEYNHLTILPMKHAHMLVRPILRFTIQESKKKKKNRVTRQLSRVWDTELAKILSHLSKTTLCNRLSLANESELAVVPRSFKICRELPFFLSIPGGQFSYCNQFPFRSTPGYSV